MLRIDFRGSSGHLTVKDQPRSLMAGNIGLKPDAISFKGIHEDAVVGIETKINGISQYQDNATSLKFRFITRGKQGKTDKIPLRLILDDEKSEYPEAIAVYHRYKDKDYKLGYLPKPIAAQIRPLIKDDYRFKASVINVFGAPKGDNPVGVRIRLEYLHCNERSPNDRKVEKVKDAFREAMKTGEVLSYREEEIIESKKYDDATRMKIDTERMQAVVYRSGWEQLRADISDNPAVVNSRLFRQDQTFRDHIANAVKVIAEKIKQARTPAKKQYRTDKPD